MKYIIDIEDEPKGGLYKAKNFRTLVFDEDGLQRLEPYDAAVDFTVGDEVEGHCGGKYVVIAVYPSTVKVVDGYGSDYIFHKKAIKRTTRHCDILEELFESLRGE